MITKARVRFLLGFLAAPLGGHAAYWALLFSTGPILAAFRRTHGVPPDSVGIPRELALLYFIILPVMAAVLAGVIAARVGQSRSPLFAVASAMLVGFSPFAVPMSGRTEPVFVGFCLLLVLSAFLGCIGTQRVLSRQSQSKPYS